MSKRKARQPIYLRTRRLIDPASGAEVSAMVPAGAADAALIRERGVTIGQLLRGDITQPRNYEYHKLAHRLGDLVRENIDGFEGLDAHQTLKKLQEDSEVECDVTLTEIPGVGTLRSVQPRSMAFDAMEQGEFYQFMRGLSQHIVRRYWPQCSPEEIAGMIDLMPQETS